MRRIGNLIELVSLLINAYIVLNHSVATRSENDLFEIDLTSIASLILWIMLIRQIRLFSTTAFYVKLIYSIIIDTKIFISLIAIIICAFAFESMIVDRYFINKSKASI